MKRLASQPLPAVNKRKTSNIQTSLGLYHPLASVAGGGLTAFSN